MGAHSDIGGGCDEAKFQKAHDLIEKMLSSGTNSRVKPRCNSAEIRQGNCPTVMQAYLDMKRTGLDNQGDLNESDPVILFDTDPDRDEQIQINNYLAWIKTNYGTTLTTKLRD